MIHQYIEQSAKMLHHRPAHNSYSIYRGQSAEKEHDTQVCSSYQQRAAC